MGIIRKGKSNIDVSPQKPTPAIKLETKEIGFIIAKLRQAEYKGSEFEQFYKVMTKLQQMSENN